MKIKAFSLFLTSIFILSTISFQLYAAPKKDKEKKMKKSEMMTLITEYEQEINDLEGQVSQLQEENNNIGASLSDAEMRNTELETQMQDLIAKTSPYLSDEMSDELYFKVQLGAYKKLDIQESFQNAKTLQTEAGTDGVKKYVVGEFPTLEAAKKFESDLKILGISDAWLVPFKNEKRISDEEASDILGKDIRQ